MRIDPPLTPPQLHAYEKLIRLRVGALYMEPGTGKERTALELIIRRMERGRIDHTLWLCPCDAQSRIAAELNRLWAGASSCITLIGMEGLSHSWKLALRVQSMIEGRRVMLIVDGGQLIKNPKTVRTQRILKLAHLCPYRLLISETSLTRSVEDMYAQWLLLDWRILGYQSFWSFSINHLNAEASLPGRREPHNVDYLLRRIQPYTAQVLLRDCMLADSGREYLWKFKHGEGFSAYYLSVIRRYLATAERSRADACRLLIACQQMTSGRRVVAFRPLRTAPMYADVRDNPRICSLLQVLKHFPGSRILILCRFTYEIRDVMEALSSGPYADQAHLYTRSTPAKGQLSLARILVMNRLCACPAADMQWPEVIIHYSHDWDWNQRRKAEFRVPAGVRQVVSLVAVNTIDELIMDSLDFKKNLADILKNGLRSLLMNEETKSNA